FFFQAEDGIRDFHVTGVQTCALPISLVTAAAQREMIIPSLIPIVFTVVVGLISVQALGGLLIGVIVVGFFFAVLMTAGGGAWDRSEERRVGKERRVPWARSHEKAEMC